MNPGSVVEKGRRDRLEQILDLARNYQGWSSRQMAGEMGRDPAHLVPEGGVPKMDMVVNLARVLDWSVEDVVKYLWDGVEEEAGEQSEIVEGDFELLQKGSLQSHREGRYPEAVQLARQARKQAKAGEEQAICCTREASGWRAQGRFQKAHETILEGLRESGVSDERRDLLLVNLANACYSLWRLAEAETITKNLIMKFEAGSPTTRITRVTQAFAHHLRGNCNRRMLATEQGKIIHYARHARHDLSIARGKYLELASDLNEDVYEAIAHTCAGGLLEVETALEERSPEDSLQRIGDSLQELTNLEDFPSGDQLESHGWWCVFGCNIALRHLTDERELHKIMAVFTNKADETAEKLGNWELRERVFTLEYARRQRFVDWTGQVSDWTMDREDQRIIIGAMGRFPDFRSTGWRILNSSILVTDK